MANVIHVVPLADGRWAVTYKGDPTPISAHRTVAEARTEAHNHAREFGVTEIAVFDKNGDIVDGELVEPEFDGAPRPSDVKGPTAG